MSLKVPSCKALPAVNKSNAAQQEPIQRGQLKETAKDVQASVWRMISLQNSGNMDKREESSKESVYSLLSLNETDDRRPVSCLQSTEIVKETK